MNEDILIAHTPIFDLFQSKEEVEEGFKPFRIKAPEWVSIIAEKDSKFMMVKQFRYGINKECEEFPCGMVDDGENPLNAARREFREETGLDSAAGYFTYLGKYAANPGFMTNYMHYFYIDLNKSPYTKVEKQLDEHEHLVSYWKDKNETFDDFLKSNGSSILGCAWMLLLKENIIGKTKV